MCLIIFSYCMNPEFPLVLAGNRDEFYSRPTLSLGFWDDDPSILAGRDLKEMGTWLGISKNGKIAAITNFRDPSSLKPDAPSRGDLIRNYLQGADPPHTYLKKVKKRGQEYNGFNLLAGDENQLFYYSNQSDPIIEMTPGLYGLSNHLLDTPWPKVEKGKSTIKPIFSTSSIDIDAVFNTLYDTSFPLSDQLPDTGIGDAWEKVLSPMFIKSDSYGTRSSSVLIISKTGHITFAERTYTQTPNGEIKQNTKKFDFQRRQNAIL